MDEAFCSRRRSSPVDAPPALRVPSVEVPSAQGYFLREMNTTVKIIPRVGWVGWS